MKKGRGAALGKVVLANLTGIAPTAVLSKRQREGGRETRSLHFGRSQNASDPSNRVCQFGAGKRVFICEY
jgi:hypothetical protein